MELDNYQENYDEATRPGATLVYQAMYSDLLEYIPVEMLGQWGEEMEGLGYLSSANHGLNKALLANGGTKKRDDMVTRTILNYVYEFAYNDDDPQDIYYRERSKGAQEPFRRVPPSKDGSWLKKKIIPLYQIFFRLTPAAEIKACMDNIYQSVMKPADLDNGLWYTCPDLFWDAEGATLIDESGLHNREVYKEIGATSYTPGVDASLIKEEFDRWGSIFAEYEDENTRRDFEEFYKELPVDYQFVKAWAKEGSNGWLDRYWDTCIATATNFMYNKPPIMYMLKGKTRNGKSTYVDHLHNLIGRHQTTDLTLPDLSDWSLNNTLFGSLMNAPDEDPASKLDAKATAAFKTLASKGEMKVQVKYSSIPLRVKPRFMMFDPRNELPEFFGDPIPCLKRIKFIFFLNDFSKMDNLPTDFWKETFTDHPEMLSRYVGFLLALAKYFSEHEMWYSKTMEASADYVAETVVSTNLYYRIWKTFYAGYESFDILKKDYINFCRERGYEVNNEAVLRSEFFQEGQNYKKRYYAGSKSKIYMYTTEGDYSTESYKMGRRILCRDEYIPGYGTAKDIIDRGMSCVDILKKQADDAIENSPVVGHKMIGGEDE